MERSIFGFKPVSAEPQTYQMWHFVFFFMCFKSVALIWNLFHTIFPSTAKYHPAPSVLLPPRGHPGTGAKLCGHSGCHGRQLDRGWRKIRQSSSPYFNRAHAGNTGLHHVQFADNDRSGIWHHRRRKRRRLAVACRVPTVLASVLDDDGLSVSVHAMWCAFARWGLTWLGPALSGFGGKLGTILAPYGCCRCNDQILEWHG